MRTAWLVALAAGLIPMSRAGAQAGGAVSVSVAQRASSHIRAGQFDSAQVLYSRMLLSAKSRGDSARALYGSAFARQQAVALDTSAELEMIVATYRQAQRLDSQVFGWAQYNIATAYSSAGRHRDAAEAYVAAIPKLDSLRATLELRAGREYVEAGMPLLAASLLANAARSARTRSEAQAALLDLYLRGRKIDSVVAIVRRLEGAAAPRSTASAALIAAIRDPEWAATKWGEVCLVLLAKNYAAMDLGPNYFDASQRADLEAALGATQGTLLEGALTALRDVYLPRDSNQVFRPVPRGSWWLETTERHAAWSSTLRSLGDWYDRAGYGRVAISFYEAAVGLPDGLDMFAPWLDLEALPPLAALYATTSDDGNRQKISRIGQFAEAVFSGKGSAYAKGDWERIRQFHLTLGTLYALQGKWEGGVTGGIFQIERLRIATKELRQRRDLDVHDPPKLLELLALEYRRRGCVVEGARVATQARDEYRRIGADADAARMEGLLRSLRETPPAARSPNCSRYAV